jgi:hypothetical protein
MARGVDCGVTGRGLRGSAAGGGFTGAMASAGEGRGGPGGPQGARPGHGRARGRVRPGAQRRCHQTAARLGHACSRGVVWPARRGAARQAGVRARVGGLSWVSGMRAPRWVRCVLGAASCGLQMQGRLAVCGRRQVATRVEVGRGGCGCCGRLPAAQKGNGCRARLESKKGELRAGCVCGVVGCRQPMSRPCAGQRDVEGPRCAQRGEGRGFIKARGGARAQA